MPNSAERKSFSWLHFSDWHHQAADREHIGVAQWEALLKDLEVIHDDSGPWDAIFITGDLSFAGRPSEFDAFSSRLHQLLAHLKKLGSSPKVLSVPGNHDAAWQELSRGLQVVLALQSVIKSLSGHDELGQMLRQYDEQFRGLISQSFSHYDSWSKHWNPENLKRGLFAGDFSTTLQVNGLRVGVVGLNTATADFTEGDFVGRPLIEARQLNAVCGDDPDEWGRSHDFSLLLTHHAPSQLEPESRLALQAEVAPPGRFLLHLCGALRKGQHVVRLHESPALLVQSPPTRQPSDFTVPGYVAGYLQSDSGAYDLSLRPRRYQYRRRAYAPDREYDPALLDEYRHTTLRSASRRLTTAGESAPQPAGDSTLVLERLDLVNFRSFKRLGLDFTHKSNLPGRWTCLAGINGAGKSSIIQALCLILLGEPYVFELGGDRLNRTRRADQAGGRHVAEVRAWVNDGEKRHFLELKLKDEPLAPSGEAEGHRRAMHEFWKMMRSRIVLAYGATRNLSDFRDTRHASMSPDVRRVMTVFDPLTQVASAEALLAEYPSEEMPLLRLFRQLLKDVFGNSFDVSFREGRVWFMSEGSVVDALDLPDGFRSSVAWLADLCAVWAEKFPERAAAASPKDIEAIVLMDEIDLHLHPSLQRVLVPRLREALPRVQWVVTTHSPLILSSFDSAEIIALDRREPGGVRFLDRQILGFTTDEIYNWLMETPATSAVMEQQLAGSRSRPNAADDDLARLIEMSPDVSEVEAEERLRQRKELIDQLESLNP